MGGGPNRSGGASPGAARLAGPRQCHGERGLVPERARPVVVLHLDAVVGVDALAIRIPERVRSPVVVGNDGKVSCGPPENLTADARRFVELSVGLPAIDDPGFDLQLVA